MAFSSDLLEKIDRSIQDAEQWIKQSSVEGRWRVPVISECMRSTAYSLLITEGRRRERAIQYLIKKKIWEKSMSATSILVWALLSQGEKSLALEVSRNCAKSYNLADRSVSDANILDYLLRKTFPKSTYSLREWPIRVLMKGLMKNTSSRFWACRTCQLYDFIPTIASMFFEDKIVKAKLIELLVLAQNDDGSYGGTTINTIKAAYLLQALGEENRSRKAIRWLDNVYNANGSLRPIYYQDVYDTAWAVIALSDTNGVEKSITWLDETMVEGLGYPYYSGGFYPDCDDTSLVLLARKELGYSVEEKTVNFLMKSQNPDGGWGWISFYSLNHTLPYKFLASRVKFIRDELRKWGSVLYWRPDFDSTIDITSRVLITLAKVARDNESKKKAVSMGVNYLLSRYEAGRFHQRLRWTFSDAYETSMALIALSLYDVGSTVKNESLNWLLSLQNLGGEELAHLIWAFSTANVQHTKLAPFVERLVSIQRDDGSWPSTTPFKASSPFYDPLFSTALPLFALKMISRNRSLK